MCQSADDRKGIYSEHFACSAQLECAGLQTDEAEQSDWLFDGAVRLRTIMIVASWKLRRFRHLQSELGSLSGRQEE